MSRQTFRRILLGSAAVLLLSILWLGDFPDPVLNNAEGAQLMADRAGFGNATPIDFKLLSKVHLEKKTDFVFPEALKKLDGQRVTLTGFMAPFDDIEDMTRSLVMPTNAGCYFCQPPSLDQVALIMQKKGGRHPYFSGPVIAMGTFRLYHDGSTHPGHLAEFLYVIDDAEIHALKEGDVAPSKPSRATGHAKGVLPGL